MEEKDLKKLIREQSEETKIPDSLEPENVMKQLEGRAKKRKQAYYKKFVAAAACCAVVAGVGVAGASGLFVNQENASGEKLASAEKSDRADGVVKATAIASAKDYDEVYAYIEAENKRWKQMEKKSDAMGMMAKEEESVGEAAVYDADGGAYSDTNIREEGVGEGDIVKTDGNCMYVLNNQQIHIIDITQDKMDVLAEIKLPDETYVSEIFVKNDRLIAVYTQMEVEEDPEGKDGGEFYWEYTVAETFDISNPEAPESVGKISQSGSFYSMRVVGDYAYLFSYYYPGMEVLRGDADFYIPKVQGTKIDSTDIFLPSFQTGNRYTVITSFALQNPKEQIDTKAVFGISDMCYVSGENIYICENNYGDEDGDMSKTCIRKISYKDGVLKAVGQAKINGTLNDSFSIDEYKGNLRLVTTIRYNRNAGIMPIALFEGREEDSSEDSEDKEEKDSNVLYILDENLNELSRIEGLAEEEQVYSARFMGPAGYFVTYKQIDPLFSVDLSDPKNPKILGELKIPGFSEYLHPYGEGLLLGIGMDVDESGTTTNGVKLSMFDISNPANVQEIQKYVLEGVYSTDVAYNYKAAFINLEKNMIGFTAYEEVPKYMIFSYDESGFQVIFERELTGLSTDVRAFYAGDRFYLAAGNTVESYRLDIFEKIDDIVL